MMRPGSDAERALAIRAKQVLRQRMRSVRRVLPKDACAARSAALCSRIIELPAFARARTVVGYVAFGNEADPCAALARAHEGGKRTGLVRVEGAGRLSVRAHRPGDPLAAHPLGMREPRADAPTLAEAEIDVILVPALGVDERGQRLGYGKGYYDRFLPRLPNATAIVLVYDFQLLFEMPAVEGDHPVDYVVTDKRVVEIAEHGP
jgi:5-formyltetrahydrofolate cyclo-ligase